MSTRLAMTVAVAVLLGIPAAPGLGQEQRSRGIDELRERDQMSRRPGESVPDARTYKSLTTEERRERTLRRKLRRVDELIEKGQYKEGATLLESLRVGRSAGEFAHVQNTLAFAYSRSDRPEKAIKHYEQVLSTPGAPASVEYSARRQLARLYYGQGSEQLWDEDAELWFRRALSSMESLIGASPDADPRDYIFLSRIQVELGDFEGGVESLETAIRIANERGVPILGVRIQEEWTALLERMKSGKGD